MDPNAKTPDDLEAVRAIAVALAPFKKEDQERIIRWARERVGLAVLESGPAGGALVANAGGVAPASVTHPPAPVQTGGNIKQFVELKTPKSDMHFAAVVAYYYRFNAPSGERKSTVTAEDLQDACRKADRDRLKKPGQTLINAFHAGLLDREDRGQFRINSVGENLVAMALPASPEGSNRQKKRSGKVKNRAGKPKSKR